MAIPSKPITRQETYLANIAGEKNELPTPITREEQYLDYIANHGGGGGGEGTTIDFISASEYKELSDGQKMNDTLRGVSMEG